MTYFVLSHSFSSHFLPNTFIIDCLNEHNNNPISTSYLSIVVFACFVFYSTYLCPLPLASLCLDFAGASKNLLVVSVANSILLFVGQIHVNFDHSL